MDRFENFYERYHHWLYGNCAVLLYHRVADIKTDPQLLCVKANNFESHIALLNEKYNVIEIDQLLYYLKAEKKIPRKSVLISFDDGYADNYLEALSILEKYNTQALFYIATGTLNTDNEFWWDAVERIVLLSDEKPHAEIFQLKGKTYSLIKMGDSERMDFYQSLLPELRIMKSSEREEKIKELSLIFNSTKGRSSHRALTFEELKKMSRSNSAVIGAHTHFHPSLAALSYQEQFTEIETSKNILEELLNKRIIHFSYPFGGRSHFNEYSVEICKQLKFEMAAANIPGMVNKYADKYFFPRFLVRDWNVNEFENRLQQFFGQ